MVWEHVTSAFYTFTKTRVFRCVVVLATAYVVLAVGYNLYKSLYPNPYFDKRSILGGLSNRLFDQNTRWEQRNSSTVHLNKEQLMNILSCTDERKIRSTKKYETAPFENTTGNKIHENATHRRDAFRAIYLNGEWSKNQSVSGPGSTVEITKNIRTTLQAVVNQIKKEPNKTVVRILDIPCGDFAWMRQFLSGRNDIMYTGMDIVPELVQRLQKENQNNSRVSFKLADITTDPLTNSYDLIFSRHMTQHLTNQDTLKTLKAFSDSGSRYLLMTTYPNARNTDLQYGAKFRFRAQNLELPPYALSPPVCQDIDGDIDITALWRLPLTQISKCVTPSVLEYQKDVFNRRVYSCI